MDSINKPIASVLSANQSIIITGNIYDLTTSGLKSDIEVRACRALINNNITTYKTIGSVKSNIDGNYYLLINEKQWEELYKEYIEENNSEILLPNFEIDLFLFAFQGNKQLRTDKSYVLRAKAGLKAMVNISIYTYRTIKGHILRSNNTNGAGILVELWKPDDITPLERTFTDFKGNYEIAYDIDYTNMLKKYISLRFYNSDFVIHQPITNLPIVEINDYKQSYSGAFPATIPLPAAAMENDLTVKTDTATGIKYYYLIKEVSPGTFNNVLVYIKDEANPVVKNYWRVIGNYKVLDKRVVTSFTFDVATGKTIDKTGRARQVYMKKSNFPPSENAQNITGQIVLDKSIIPNTSENKYYLEEESYKEEYSAKITSTDYIIQYSFKFTQDTLDLYTKIKESLSNNTVILEEEQSSIQ